MSCIHNWELINKFETDKQYSISYTSNGVMRITKLVYVCHKCGEIKVIE